MASKVGAQTIQKIDLAQSRWKSALPEWLHIGEETLPVWGHFILFIQYLKRTPNYVQNLVYPVVLYNIQIKNTYK